MCVELQWKGLMMIVLSKNLRNTSPYYSQRFLNDNFLPLVNISETTIFQIICHVFFLKKWAVEIIHLFRVLVFT